MKIIGYKAPYDLFGGIIKKDTIYKPLSSEKITTYAATENDKIIDSGKTNLPSEIVETWEPYYKNIEYPLSYKDLKRGEFYTKEKENQEKFTFKYGYDLWYSHVKKSIITSFDIFDYSTKFDNFRKATQEEIDFFKQEKEFTLSCSSGIFYLIVTEKGLYYKLDDRYLCISNMRKLIEEFSFKENGYEFKKNIKSVDMGCKKNVPIEDLKVCIDYYDKVFKS